MLAWVTLAQRRYGRLPAGAEEPEHRRRCPGMRRSREPPGAVRRAARARACASAALSRATVGWGRARTRRVAVGVERASGCTIYQSNAVLSDSVCPLAADR
jgi:hypothetical protein